MLKAALVFFVFRALSWPAVAFLFLGVAMPGVAYAVDETIYQAIAGPWLFASEASGGACVLTLSSTRQAGHHPVTGAGACQGTAGAIAAAVVWDLDPDGALTFRDGAGKTLIRLAEDPDGQYFQQDRPKGVRFVLMAANEGSERLIRIADMGGHWTFRRLDGASVCEIAFSFALLPTSSTFRALTLAPECDPGLAKLKLVKWHVEGALLVLVGSETADLTLVPKADGSFVKSAKEGGKPLRLTRR